MKTIAINADYSNRDKSINTLEKLTSQLVILIQTEQPTIITISEARATLVKKHLEKQSSLKDYIWEYSKIGYDYIVTGYNKKLYKVIPLDNHGFEFYYSTQGKYQICVLEELETNRKILHASVHFPHKKGKKLAVELTAKAINDIKSRHEIDGVVVSGDFNSTYEKVAEDFEDADLVNAFKGESTTINSTTPDNILYSGDSLNLSSKKVCKGIIKLSHHPISATFEWL